MEGFLPKTFGSYIIGEIVNIIEEIKLFVAHKRSWTSFEGTSYNLF